MGITTYLTQTADIYPPAIGADGIPGYAATATYSSVHCRFQPKSRQRQDAKGNIIITDGLFFFDADVTIVNQSKIVFGSNSYEVVSIEPMYGLSEIDHYEITVKSL